MARHRRRLDGITGMPLAKPQAIEVHADGTVSPKELTFEPLPPADKR